jgi:hypothetical protein
MVCFMSVSPTIKAVNLHPHLTKVKLKVNSTTIPPHIRFNPKLEYIAEKQGRSTRVSLKFDSNGHSDPNHPYNRQRENVEGIYRRLKIEASPPPVSVSSPVVVQSQEASLEKQIECVKKLSGFYKDPNFFTDRVSKLTPPSLPSVPKQKRAGFYRPTPIVHESPKLNIIIPEPRKNFQLTLCSPEETSPGTQAKCAERLLGLLTKEQLEERHRRQEMFKQLDA